MRFPRRSRLLNPADFERVFKSGRRETTPLLTAVVVASAIDQARLGLAISKKQAALAVDRNRLKRQIRASFREAQDRLPACDIVIMAKPMAKARPRDEFNADLQKLWIRIAQRWSASSSS
ncbi:ribonuclease P protein component [Hydrocarboniphaga sp.]|uniref:ribonuclease P protein component n=1 Tax=Hydrocarboniphaga sp. TaxID=2033016 RepID=UPI003D0AFE32